MHTESVSQRFPSRPPSDYMEIDQQTTKPDLMEVTEENELNDFLQLPSEIFLIIFSKVSDKDLDAISLVCRRWNLCANDGRLWHCLFQKKYPLIAEPNEKNIAEPNEINWKGRFKFESQLDSFWSTKEVKAMCSFEIENLNSHARLGEFKDSRHYLDPRGEKFQQSRQSKAHSKNQGYFFPYVFEVSPTEDVFFGRQDGTLERWVDKKFRESFQPREAEIYGLCLFKKWVITLNSFGVDILNWEKKVLFKSIDFKDIYPEANQRSTRKKITEWYYFPVLKTDGKRLVIYVPTHEQKGLHVINLNDGTVRNVKITIPKPSLDRLLNLRLLDLIKVKDNGLTIIDQGETTSQTEFMIA